MAKSKKKSSDQKHWLVSFKHSKGTITKGDVVTAEHEKMFKEYIHKCKYAE